MTKTKIHVFLLAALLLAACSGKPDIAMIEEDLNSIVDDQGFRDYLEVQNVHYISDERPDDNTYLAKVGWDYEFKMSSEEVARRVKNNLPSDPEEAKKMSGAAETLLATFGEFQKGEVRSFQQAARFIKIDGNWKLM